MQCSPKFGIMEYFFPIELYLTKKRFVKILIFPSLFPHNVVFISLFDRDRFKEDIKVKKKVVVQIKGKQVIRKEDIKERR
jgi:hypothetical protein